MNLELIRKYEKEFLHMLHGGKVLMGKKDPITNTTKWYPSVLNPFVETSDTTVVVIDDEYCTYRKALADGKTIEYYTIANYKRTITRMDELEVLIKANHSGKYIFRIKPEEPKFKVGDYVIEIYGNQLHKVLELFPNNLRVYGYSINASYTAECSDFKLWEPKEDEVCIFWDNKHTNEAIIARYSHSERSFYYPLKMPNSCYQNCMPFTGTLPPHMKD